MSVENTLQNKLNTASIELWALFNLAVIGRKAAFAEDAEAAEIAHLLGTMEQRLGALHDSLHMLAYSDAVKAVAAIENGGAKK